jgi:CheY-like chemotaxis protein
VRPVALIIDDNPDNLIALAALLTLERVMSVTVMSPSGVFATLDQIGQVNVVFLDLKFPNHDGLTLIKELQADARLRDVPFVAYTLHTDRQNEAWDAGFHSFIGKPLNVERFPAQLRQILSDQRVWEVE